MRLPRNYSGVTLLWCSGVWVHDRAEHSDLYSPREPPKPSMYGKPPELKGHGRVCGKRLLANSAGHYCNPRGDKKGQP